MNDLLIHRSECPKRTPNVFALVLIMSRVPCMRICEDERREIGTVPIVSGVACTVLQQGHRHDMTTGASARTEKTSRLIGYERKKPRTEPPGILEAAALSEHVHPGLLQYIFGRVYISEHASQVREKFGLVTTNQVGERPFIPLNESAEKLFV